jgi:transcriptional regulator with GAF, ATPase, and Fis domain
MTDQPLFSTYFGILPQMPESKILRLLLETGIQVLDADEASLLVHDSPSKTLRFALTVGNDESAATLEGQSIPIGQGLTGLAAMTREVQTGAPVFHDVHQTHRRDPGSDEPEAVIAAPMVVGESLIGVLTAVSFRAGKRFTGSDAKLYARYAAIAGQVVDQCRRLAAIEARDRQILSSPAFSEQERAEQSVLASIANIVNHNRAALPHLALMLKSLEAIVLGKPVRGS